MSCLVGSRKSNRHRNEQHPVRCELVWALSVIMYFLQGDRPILGHNLPISKAAPGGAVVGSS
jgi:hypothetical protein